MVYAQPGTEGSIVKFARRYDNFIGGEWVAPAEGRYFDNPSPVDGKVFCEVARSTAADVELRPGRRPRGGRPSGAAPPPRSAPNILNRIADRIEENLEKLAVAETWENGKPVRETLAADMPLAVDHFRYFAGVVRGAGGQHRGDRRGHRRVPLPRAAGRGRPDHPVELPDPDGRRGSWRPALAAGNCVVIKPAEQTPASLLLVIELIADLLPPGVVNVVNGFGVEAGKPLASSPRVAKVAFTGETTTGRLIMQYASARTSSRSRWSWAARARTSSCRT